MALCKPMVVLSWVVRNLLTVLRFAALALCGTLCCASLWLPGEEASLGRATFCVSLQ